MAGRVQRRINDRFYFVLDEVGDSDCELEDNAQSKNISPDKSNVLGNDKSPLSPSKTGTVETTNENLNTEITDVINHNATEFKNCENVNEDKQKGEESTGSTDKSSEVIGQNMNAEESSAVVDMDIDSDTEDSDSNVKPLCKITFRDEGVEELLKNSLFKIFSLKVKHCTIITNSENSLEYEIYDKDPAKLLGNDLLDFDLDTTPGDNHSDVLYGKSHDLVLSDITLEEPESKKSASACFNCLGNHNLKDCPKEKNFRVINKNRLKFQSQNKYTKNSRYHLDENQKFGHILPGVISKKLRNALNLRKDQQPGFIYKMRHLGYPPAWLEEAKVSHSGVVMYNNTGVPVLEEDEEEGEIVPEGAKDKFDITKIIEFPGFNVPLPDNCKDETKFYLCPALSENQSKENLIKLLEPKTVQAYVKKSLVNKKSQDDSSADENTKRTSPSIEEMEEKKRLLLLALNDEDSASDPSKIPSEDSVSNTEVTELVSGESLSKDTSTPENREVGSVKNLEFGTPILKSVSQFSKLPSREQFSVNVSDVINFENLPNSTGKYETMRHVISKIRITTSKSQSQTQ